MLELATIKNLIDFAEVLSELEQTTFRLPDAEIITEFLKRDEESKPKTKQSNCMSDLPKGWTSTTLDEILSKPQYGWTSTRPIIKTEIKAEVKRGTVYIKRGTSPFVK